MSHKAMCANRGGGLQSEDQVADIMTKPLKLASFFKLRKLFGVFTLDAITESIAGDMDTLPKLISILRQSLVTKRYVIVFYDIWDINFWKVMKLAFPNNDEGSRIVITTRNDEVASSNKETPCDFVLKIQPLSQELSWELFCKKAFCFEFETRCPRELEELPLKIVKKCQGLPLVITTVGA
ncbi:hypothetical protein FEM48_Zijuj06G0194600 [Ziziphus jujuba var. spinosa]|uniref:NB-ARC domain-containing protein n=1 Tax=Ziziphus jujuba var. spinosa TaxID=714518 RepID=A0A978VB66_ZIZJJ|nr:hypothetical protein FEM48_Zijuj06G0194600 [Ziziphus jujuba var. spinosa]